MMDRFTIDDDTALAIQIGRPIDAWFETYCRRTSGDDAPDRYLRMEVGAFIDAMRRRARRTLGAGMAADMAAALISCAGMIARDAGDLDRGLANAADWHRTYAPRTVRAGLAADRRELRSRMDVRRATVAGRLRRIVDRHAFDLHPLTLDGTRSFPFGGTTGVLRVGDGGDMQFGVIRRGMLCIVSQIDDRDGGGRRARAPEPAPEPELAH